ncbi:MAG: adenylate/guanylate cyclase domain-containing protein, partial [Bacteroidota bacterium]
LCMFYTEVSNHIGQTVLMNLFTGKYHHPIEEERIFMFLDMKSSTTIAEQLGHLNYFKLLKTYYADLSAPIIQHGGEIYDYIGDEIIITWKYKKGEVNNNCLHCFFDMKTALQQQAQKFQSTYGVVPTFKAGIHLGKVTSGEIGIIKREITFSGDVLNTTARIQGLCNQYEVDLLISGKLRQVLAPDPDLEMIALGIATLRGRNKKIDLLTVKKKDALLKNDSNTIYY